MPPDSALATLQRAEMGTELFDGDRLGHIRVGAGLEAAVRGEAEGRMHYAPTRWMGVCNTPLLHRHFCGRHRRWRNRYLGLPPSVSRSAPSAFRVRAATKRMLSSR